MQPPVFEIFFGRIFFYEIFFTTDVEKYFRFHLAFGTLQKMKKKNFQFSIPFIIQLSIIKFKISSIFNEAGKM